MPEVNIPTADLVHLRDVREEAPPDNAEKLLLLTVYGVLTIGTYQKGFHVAWSPLPKIPPSIKGRLK